MEFIPRFGSINKHIEMHSVKIMELNTLNSILWGENAKRNPRVKILARKQTVSVWMFGTIFAHVHILGAQFCTVGPHVHNMVLGKRRLKSKGICRENRALKFTNQSQGKTTDTRSLLLRQGLRGLTNSLISVFPRCPRVKWSTFNCKSICIFLLPVGMISVRIQIPVWSRSHRSQFLAPLLPLPLQYRLKCQTLSSYGIITYLQGS